MRQDEKLQVAAHSLLGHTLPGGWHVTEKIERPIDATGSCFSVGYVVEQSGEKAFLKVLNYSVAFGSTEATRVLEAMTSAYNFEVDVLERCAASHMDRVVTILDHGDYIVEGSNGIPNVSYLIFELADGDIRNALDSMGSKFDAAWALRTLHHAATGLWQLHGHGIAHQDVKPSNVLTFDAGSAKLGDLGRASRRGISSPHEENECAGDPAYAPPELLYHQVDPDWGKRRQSCDTYLLGSLILFMFSGATMTAAVLSHLRPEQLPKNWGDSYGDVLPFVRVAFDEIIAEFEELLPEGLSEPLARMVRQLCDPEPDRRGHPRERARRGNAYSLERYVSELNLLARRAEIGYFGNSS